MLTLPRPLGFLFRLISRINIVAIQQSLIFAVCGLFGVVTTWALAGIVGILLIFLPVLSFLGGYLAGLGLRVGQLAALGVGAVFSISGVGCLLSIVSIQAMTGRESTLVLVLLYVFIYSVGALVGLVPMIMFDAAVYWKGVLGFCVGATAGGLLFVVFIQGSPTNPFFAFLAYLFSCAGGGGALAQALNSRKRSHTPHPNSSNWQNVAFNLANLAERYKDQGKYAKAEPLYRRLLGIREKALGPDHPDVAACLNNLAGLYRAQGKYAKAEPLYRRLLGIREKALGPDHPDVAACLNNLAGLYRAQGKYAEAVPLYRRSLGIWEKDLGPDHPDVATSLHNLAVLLKKTNREAEAAKMDSIAKEIISKKR